MPRIPRPEVSSPELRSALDRVGSHIENYNENLDRLSKDILSIEQYLTASGVRETAYVKVGYSEEFTDGEYDVLRNYSGGIARDVENIEWGPVSDEPRARWRLMFHRFRRLGSVDICEGIAIAGPTFADGGTRLEYKPLIETPAGIRLNAHKHLGKLVERIGQSVEFTPFDKGPTADAADSNEGEQ